ncbi:putative mitochondrial protein AtMg00860 [Bidens hawaiensis]|uniref:putative mitochondrial protein AtMg00860 n=1 Tax=Bidens hawaiensis TaxID=980011 RepID=UPI00404946BC
MELEGELTENMEDGEEDVVDDVSCSAEIMEVSEIICEIEAENPAPLELKVTEGIVFGHKISRDGIEVDRVKIDTISRLPPPTNVKARRSFLGHAGFYRRFTKDFSKITGPMTRLLEKDVPFVFDEACLKAFKFLKYQLVSAPILVSPDWNLPFKLMFVASDYAVGAVLG